MMEEGDLRIRVGLRDLAETAMCVGVWYRRPTLPARLGLVRRHLQHVNIKGKRLATCLRKK